MRIIELLQVYELVEHNNGILTACVVVGSEHVVANAVYDAGLSCPCDRVLCPVSCNVGEVSSLLSLCVLSNAVEDSYDLSTGDLCSRIKVAVVAALDVAVLDCPCNCGLCVILNVSLVAEGECLLGSDGALQTPQHGDEVLTGDVSGREEVAIVVALDDAFLGCPCNCVLSIIPDGSSVLELRCYNGLFLAADGADTVLVLVAECGYHFALLYGLVANGADLVAGVAGFGAGSSLCVLNLGLVAECGDLFASLEELAAPLADGVAGVASLSAGCVLNVCKISCCSVGKCLYDEIRICQICAANGASLYRQAVGGASCGNEFFNNIVVTLGDGLVNICVALSLLALYGLAISVFPSVGADIVVVILLTILGASCRNVCCRNKVVVELLNDFCLLGDSPASIGVGPNLLSLTFCATGSCNSRLSPSCTNFSYLVEINVLIERKYIAAEVLFADAAINTVGLAVVLNALCVNIRIVSNVFFSNAQCTFSFVSFEERVKRCALNDATVINVCYASCFAIGAVRIAFMASGATSAINISVIPNNACSAIYKLNFVCIQRGTQAANSSIVMSRLRCCMILNSTIFIVYVLLRSYECILVCVTRIDRCELCIDSIHLCSADLNVLVLGKKRYCCIYTLNENRVLAVVANSVAPAFIDAGRLYNDGEIAVNMLKFFFDFQAVGLLSTAVYAVSKSDANLLAGSLLKLNSLPLVVALVYCGLLCKGSYCFQILFASVAINDIDAGLLCSCVYFDADNFGDLMCISVSASCQSGSRNQRCDHENSHQHAQQSLFHFLLFTSV